MTNPYEGKKIYSTAYRRQMAQAIVKGILAYQKLTAGPPPTFSVPPKSRPAKPKAKSSTQRPLNAE